MKLLLEYQQNPTFRDAYTTLQQAEEAAKYVYNNERVRIELTIRPRGGYFRREFGRRRRVSLRRD